MRGGVEPLLKKLTIISGDVGLPDLGIQAADRQKIIDETHIIIHAAATIRYVLLLGKGVFGDCVYVEMNIYCIQAILIDLSVNS